MWEIEDLPITEYLGWINFFEDQQRKQEGKGGNILAMDEDELARRFGG